MPKPKPTYTLPRGYISHNQIAKVESDPEGYVQEYIYGDKKSATVYMDFGKVIAEALDGKNNHGGGSAIKEFIPHYPKREVTAFCVLGRKNEKLILKGILDGYDSRKMLQGEYKTGRKAWTQDQVNKSLQLKIYALIHYKNTGKIPKQELTWMGTEFESGDLRLTGDFRTFQVQQTLRDILETQACVWKAHDKIISLVKRECEKI